MIPPLELSNRAVLKPEQRALIVEQLARALAAAWRRTHAPPVRESGVTEEASESHA